MQKISWIPQSFPCPLLTACLHCSLWRVCPPGLSSSSWCIEAFFILLCTPCHVQLQLGLGLSDSIPTQPSSIPILLPYYLSLVHRSMQNDPFWATYSLMITLAKTTPGLVPYLPSGCRRTSSQMCFCFSALLGKDAEPQPGLARCEIQTALQCTIHRTERSSSI